MGRLSEDDIRFIIKRATILQKYHQQSPNKELLPTSEDFDTAYSIGENLAIQREFIHEAIVEYIGSPTQEPVSVDTGSSSKAKIVGYANGSIDSALMHEIRAMCEYHFNSIGKVSRRKGNIYWKAMPSGINRFFETSSSPTLEISPQEAGQKITITQNLQTYNKFYPFVVAGLFTAVMLFAGVVFGQAGNDGTAPMLIISGMFSIAAFFISRFIRRKKIKRKEKLIELVEDLQQVIERKFRSKNLSAKQPQPSIVIEENEIDALEDIEIKISKQAPTKS
ncbi:MAG: hypothetical protein ED557_10410 [Balneola sp.]|nr:MAG: hypothetical protein ED557_10410 [Balneola sp.]